MPTEEELFRTTLTKALTAWGMSPTDRQSEQLLDHYRMMIEANRTMNLTRITDPQDAAVKHYADSLAILPWVEAQGQSVKRVLDIGTGGGFPAVPMAVMRPTWHIVALDGTSKKIAFVQRVAEALGLTNLKAIHAHSTHFRSPRRFDLVVARAIGSLTKCLAAAARHVAPGGFFVAYKTPTVVDDWAEAEAVERKSDLKPAAEYPYELELHDERLSRVLIPYRRR